MHIIDNREIGNKLLKICAALDVTPNDVLITDNEKFTKQQDDLMQLLNNCSPKNKQTALDLLSVILNP